MQPGSSIMPGKVNPVIPEVVNQVCFDVIAADLAVTLAAGAGQLQLNVFEPLIAFRLLSAISEMRNACVVLRERCVRGITANPDRLRYFVEHSIGVVTALVPAIGYERATQVAKEALDSGRGVYDIVREKGLLTRQELDRLLNPEAMTGDGERRRRGVERRIEDAIMPRRRKRLDPALFRLPVDEIRQGFYTDKYFERDARDHARGLALTARADAGERQDAGLSRAASMKRSRFSNSAPRIGARSR